MHELEKIYILTLSLSQAVKIQDVKNIQLYLDQREESLSILDSLIENDPDTEQFLEKIIEENENVKKYFQDMRACLMKKTALTHQKQEVARIYYRQA